jgi:nucleotide-binding universal stress UspA family protein
VTPDGTDADRGATFRAVLVPLDGSELALQAMPTARVLAQRFGAELQTVTVVGRADGVDHARALASAALGVPVGDNRALVVSSGDPADVISGRAEALGSCLVCMASHGRGRLHGALVGSVARSVLQRSTDPLVVLGPMADNPGWSPRPRRWPEPLSVPRVVACVDGSSTSEEVLPLAVAWARVLDMSLTILTVAEDTPVSTPPNGGPTRYGDHADARGYIEHLVQRWRTHLPATDGEVVRDPIGPASAIRAHLDVRSAGLVAMTTHSRSGIRRAFLGATAASIVHASVAPCLVAPVWA